MTDATGSAAGDLVPAVARPDRGRRPPRALPSLLGLVLGVVVVSLMHVTGTLHASDDALVVMGFDPDRARLITALIAGAAAGTSVAVLDGFTAVAALASLMASGAVFWPVLRRETTAALQASGTQGVFDPTGWLLSVSTLAIAALIVGWAVATLTAPARRFAIRARREAAETLGRRRRAPGGLARAAAAVAVVVVLAVAVPVFSDMVNYDPDVHMRAGAPVTGDLAGASGGPSGADGLSSGAPPWPSDAAGPSGGEVGPAALGSLLTGLVPGPLAGSYITPGTLSTARPWASSAPSGSGQELRFALPGPWTSGDPTARVDLYLPPGYPAPGLRYPVIYEAPYAIVGWVKVGMISMLNSMISSGTIPPVIAVFANNAGGPYQDVECADTFDRREMFDTYMAKTLVSYMDSHYPTIASPVGRVTLGSSQGGYCAAALWSHHPDVFGAAVAFSGYFQSGVRSPETTNAARPFGDNAAYEAEQSPLHVVATIPLAEATRSFVVLSADFANSFFGAQLRMYAAALADAHVPMALLEAPLGHSWQTQRDQLPTVLVMLAEWMNQQGAFGTH